MAILSEDIRLVASSLLILQKLCRQRAFNFSELSPQHIKYCLMDIGLTYSWEILIYTRRILRLMGRRCKYVFLTMLFEEIDGSFQREK